MKADANQKEDAYFIRSLYFDDLWDSCMDENESGVDERRKYRIRTYDLNSGKLFFEIKEKKSGLTKKSRCEIERSKCEDIIYRLKAPEISEDKRLNMLSMEMKHSLLRPKIIIDYERTAYINIAGNVRITFDRNISASRRYKNFFEYDTFGKVPVLPKGMHILEVKYDEFLPVNIAQVLELGNLNKTAFSKYYLGRLAVMGEFLID